METKLLKALTFVSSCSSHVTDFLEKVQEGSVNGFLAVALWIFKKINIIIGMSKNEQNSPFLQDVVTFWLIFNLIEGNRTGIYELKGICKLQK